MISFEVNWIKGDGTNPLYANTASELKIVSDENVLTRVLNKRTETMADSIKVSLYPLAEWLAFNWWRIHKEPRPDSCPLPTDLLLAHNMASIGDGFVWPNMEFFSDDQSMLFWFRKTGMARWESIKYEADFPLWPSSIGLKEFDEEIKSLINLTINRLRDLGIQEIPLATIWSDVEAEMSDPEVRAWREVEARLGYDPDEAPEPLMREIEEFSMEVGENAAEEILPILNQAETARLKELHDLSESPGIKANFQLVSSEAYALNGSPPWEIGRTLAYSVREQVDKKRGPIDNSVLAEVLGIQSKDFERTDSANGLIGLGTRNEATSSVDLHFRRKWSTGRRFEAARFIADYMTSPAEDKWLPLTDHATFRQKVQRAFAAEFLLPIEELKDFMSEDFSHDNIEAAADRFHVSPLAVSSHLANHRLIQETPH
ncbi:MAG: ImmA/IrrE family metallo-endopeptidase [Pseudohongiellaceae bacterium]